MAVGAPLTSRSHPRHHQSSQRPTMTRPTMTRRLWVVPYPLRCPPLPLHMHHRCPPGQLRQARCTGLVPQVPVLQQALAASRQRHWQRHSDAGSTQAVVTPTRLAAASPVEAMAGLWDRDNSPCLTVGQVCPCQWNRSTCHTRVDHARPTRGRHVTRRQHTRAAAAPPWHNHLQAVTVAPRALAPRPHWQAPGETCESHRPNEGPLSAAPARRCNRNVNINFIRPDGTPCRRTCWRRGRC